MPPALYTLDEVAASLNKTPRSVKDWLRRHPGDDRACPYFHKAGHTLLFSGDDVDRLRAAMRHEGRRSRR